MSLRAWCISQGIPQSTFRFHLKKHILPKFIELNHSDKYQAYEKLGKDLDRTWAPCWAHIWRKFEEAESGDPKFRKEVLLTSVHDKKSDKK